MSENKLVEVLQKIFDKTDVDKLPWQETTSSGRFRLGIGKGIIVVEMVSYDRGDGDDAWGYQAQLTNKDGETIEEVIGYAGENYKLLEALYKKARSIALKADDVYSSILSDLDKGQLLLSARAALVNNDSRLELSEMTVDTYVIHPVFGDGQIVRVIGSGDKITLAIRFSMGQKILDPRIAPLAAVPF